MKVKKIKLEVTSEEMFDIMHALKYYLVKEAEEHKGGIFWDREKGKHIMNEGAKSFFEDFEDEMKLYDTLAMEFGKKFQYTKPNEDGSITWGEEKKFDTLDEMIAYIIKVNNKKEKK